MIITITIHLRTQHTEGNNLPIVDTPVDYDDKGVSDYPESRVTVMPTTQILT